MPGSGADGTLGDVDRNRSELADFLSTRRARLTPTDAGLAGEHTRRRVPGLRREELAQLAGVSVDSYTTLDLMERLDQVNSPAFILGRRLDVLAHNGLAGALITEFRQLPAPQRNQARFVFFDPHARELYADWRQVAIDTVAMQRHDAGRHPDDPKLSELVGELSIHSEEFRTWWSRHDVQRRITGTKSYHHPVVGDLTVQYQALSPSGDDDQVLIVYTTEPGSAS